MAIEHYAWIQPEIRLAAFRQTFGTARTDRSFPLHNHTYSEAFWIERGRCRHLVNDSVERILVPGDMLFIRPTDVHTGRGVDDEGFTIVNVSFPPGVEGLMRRRLKIEPAQWPWWKEPLPRVIHLAPEQRSRLADLIAAMPAEGKGVIEQELVLLALVQASNAAVEEHRSDDAPTWLRRALQDDEVLRGGVASLVAVSQRSAAHVNRTVRRCFGITATDLLNRRRLDRAASALRLGSASVTDVALDAGFSNLAWFHRAFKARFGDTPRHYRLSVQRPVSSSGVAVALGR